MTTTSKTTTTTRKLNTSVVNNPETRFGTWFPTWYQDFGRGGVFPEGGDYGVVSLSYPLIPFASAADFGLDPYAQTPYFREAIYAMLYGTTPGPTTLSGSFSGGHLLFPFNDDENLHGGGVINARQYLGDFARALIVRHVKADELLAHVLFARADVRRVTALAVEDRAPAVGHVVVLEPLDNVGVTAHRFGRRVDRLAVSVLSGQERDHPGAGRALQCRKPGLYRRRSSQCSHAGGASVCLLRSR
mgnify:CR=1 FL=1